MNLLEKWKGKRYWMLGHDRIDKFKYFIMESMKLIYSLEHQTSGGNKFRLIGDVRMQTEFHGLGEDSIERYFGSGY
jgi:hypothetical protein